MYKGSNEFCVETPLWSFVYSQIVCNLKEFRIPNIPDEEYSICTCLYFFFQIFSNVWWSFCPHHLGFLTDCVACCYRYPCYWTISLQLDAEVPLIFHSEDGAAKGHFHFTIFFLDWIPRSRINDSRRDEK